MSLVIDAKMKKMFFDREGVQREMDNATRKAMSKQLAFIRQTARRDVLRRRKSISREGQAPSVHSRDNIGTLRNIWFVYDRRTKSGVVGPMKVNSRHGFVKATTTVPNVHEFGGSVRIKEIQHPFSGRWHIRKAKGQRWGATKYRTRRVRYKPRPFMAEALRREVASGNIMTPWANVVGS